MKKRKSRDLEVTEIGMGRMGCSSLKRGTMNGLWEKLLNRFSEDSGILDYCKENDITFFSYMVLEQ